MAVLCGLFPPGKLHLYSFPRFWAGSLPDTDFVGLADITGNRPWHARSICIRRSAIDVLLAAGVLETGMLEPIDVVETRDDARVPILDEEIGPLPESLTGMVAGRRSVEILHEARGSNDREEYPRVLVVSPSRDGGERVGVDEIGRAASRMGITTPRVWTRFLSEIGMEDLGDFLPYHPSSWADYQPDHDELSARDETLPSRMLAVGSAINGDWYSLDLDHVTEDGDCPLLRFDHEVYQCVDCWLSVAQFINEMRDDSAGDSPPAAPERP